MVSSLFILALNLATKTRIQFHFLIWFLPLAGLAIGYIYQRFGKTASKGTNLILEEIHDPQKVLPLRIAPILFVGTIITHLFGGSTGREGAIVQVSATLSDQLSNFFKVNPEERKILLTAAIGAGFSSAVGTPLAGIIFGMEILNIGKLKLSCWPQCLVASYVGYCTTTLLNISHPHLSQIILPEINLVLLSFLFLAGIIFGLTALIFSRLTHYIESFMKAKISSTPLICLIGGVMLIALYSWEGTYRYAGLGLDLINEALDKQVSFRDPLFKTLFTSLAVGSGYKGGEFIPLVIIGATLGSALSIILPISSSFLAALGFAAVFAGAANTPLACAIMAAELFGWKVFFYALIVCYTSYFFSGNIGIYRSQKIIRKKFHPLTRFIKWGFSPLLQNRK